MSELSFQEGSVYNSEMECINLEQQSETEPLDVKLDQNDDKSESHYSMPPIAANMSGQVQVRLQFVQGLGRIRNDNENTFHSCHSMIFSDSSNARGNSILT